jgi:cell division protein FtsW (lipid II flippase)
MAKKSKKRKTENKRIGVVDSHEQEEKQHSEKIEKVFKRLLRSMSWIVGICFVLIIILPQFNSNTLDKVTQILYYIGIIHLLLFTIIELIADNFKSLLSMILE